MSVLSLCFLCAVVAVPGCGEEGADVEKKDGAATPAAGENDPAPADKE